MSERSIAADLADVPVEHDSESYSLVCRQSYPPHDLMRVLMHLRRTGRTGTLQIALHQGGVGAVRFCEEHEIIPDIK